MSYADHVVSRSAVLGGPDGLGRGLSYVLGSLELGRINVAARALGVARAALDAAMRYSQERYAFGVPIVNHQSISFKLADMATKVEAARLLVASAAEKFEIGMRADVEAGMAKLFASETALEVSIEAMRIHGGYGYTKDFPVERYFRDSPLMIIGEGTNEIQRMVIARGLLSRWKDPLN
jgi:alkylation response protein AidB-like acyl-CoA dehydrogenase